MNGLKSLSTCTRNAQATHEQKLPKHHLICSTFVKMNILPAFGKRAIRRMALATQKMPPRSQEDREEKQTLTRALRAFLRGIYAWSLWPFPQISATTQKDREEKQTLTRALRACLRSTYFN